MKVNLEVMTQVSVFLKKRVPLSGNLLEDPNIPKRKQDKWKLAVQYFMGKEGLKSHYAFLR